MPDAANFCPACGSEVSATDAPGSAAEANGSPPARPFPIVPVLVGAGLLLLVLGGAAWSNGWFGRATEVTATTESVTAIETQTPVAASPGQEQSQASPPPEESPAAANGNALVGTWELVAEQCCGDLALSNDLAWEPVAASEHERVTFHSDGRFVSTSSRNPQGRWSMSDDTIEGWLIYLVVVEIKGDTMVVQHVPTSVQNAYTRKWRRVSGASAGGNDPAAQTQSDRSVGAAATTKVD